MNFHKTIITAFLALQLGCSQASFEPDVTDSAEDFIVVLKNREVNALVANASYGETRSFIVESLLASIAVNHSVVAQKTFSTVLNAGVYSLTPEQVKKMSGDPNVAYIEKDHRVSINGEQANAPWGLDRLDQVNLPLNQSYNYPTEENQVHAYIIDTGVRISHQEFAGRAAHGYDFVDKDADATDCNGHGTHVAGTLGGSTYGVAKNVKIFGVRVLDCRGSGSFSGVIAGIEWVTQNHVKPAVANLSLGGPVSQAVDDAVVAAINAGVTMVLAAGNSSTTACNSSPARVPEAITVGSTTDSDQRSSFSNFGNCVDIFAPGSNITSAWYDADDATNTISGTSMASPHVAGVVALHLAKYPNDNPAAVTEAIINGSVIDKIADTKSGSPNKLLNSNYLENPNPPQPPQPPKPPAGGELINGASVLNLAAAQGDDIEFFMAVPAGATELAFELSGGTGDADMYVKFGAKPGTANYDCRPFKAGNSEVCRFAVPQEGTYQVLIRAYRAFANVSLKASFTEDENECTNCQLITGNLGFSGDSHTYVHPQESVPGQHKLELKGPANADFDLYLEKEGNGQWTVVAKSIGTTSEESIIHLGGFGQYRVRVKSYRGAGDYRLLVVAPQ